MNAERIPGLIAPLPDILLAGQKPLIMERVTAETDPAVRCDPTQ